MSRAFASLRILAVGVIAIACMLALGSCSSSEDDPVFGASKTTVEEPSYAAEVFSGDLHLIMRVDGLDGAYEEGIKAWHEMRYSEAESLLIEARGSAMDEYSSSSVQLACVDSGLGCLYLDTACYEDAYDSLVSAQVILQDAYGQDCDCAKAVQAALAQYDYLTGDYTTCRKDIRSALDGGSPVEIWKTANRVQNLLYAADGEYVNAIRATRMMLQRFFEGKGHEIEWDETENLATYLYETEKDISLSDTDYMWLALISLDAAGYYQAIAGTGGAIERAANHYESGKVICSKNLDNYEANSLLTILKVRHAYFRSNYEDLEGEVALAEILSAIEEQGVSNDSDAGAKPFLAETYVYYADTAGFLLGDSELALSSYETAMSISEEAFGHNHPQTAQVYYRLGSYEGNKLRDNAAAEQHFNEALEIRKNILAENTPDAAVLYLNLAGVYELEGDEAKSDESLSKAKEIYQSLGLHYLQTTEEDESGNS